MIRLSVPKANKRSPPILSPSKLKESTSQIKLRGIKTVKTLARIREEKEKITRSRYQILLLGHKNGTKFFTIAKLETLSTSVALSSKLVFKV